MEEVAYAAIGINIIQLDRAEPDSREVLNYSVFVRGKNRGLILK